MPLVAAGVISGIGSIAGGLIGANAADTAAAQQVAQEQQALQFQKDIWGQQQQTMAPFIGAGRTSLAQLMKEISSGTFGPGSLPNVPTFTAPTLAQAENAPGYQFALQQGEKGIAQQAAAAGGAVSGGTLRAGDEFAQGLAQSNYNNIFNQALQGYSASLQEFGANLAKQQQEFGQAFAPVGIGLGAAESLGQTGTQASQNIGQVMQNIGASRAAGTVGGANALAAGFGGGLNSISQALTLSSLFNQGGSGGGGLPNGGMPPGGMSPGIPTGGWPIDFGIGPG